MKKYFSLIGLSDIITQHSRHITQHAVFAQAKTYSLFLKGEWGLGKGENLFSREKKFFLSPRRPFHPYRASGCYSNHRDTGSNADACVEQGA